MVPAATTVPHVQPKSVSGLRNNSRLNDKEKRDLESKQAELKNQLTFVQKENASVNEKSK